MKEERTRFLSPSLFLLSYLSFRLSEEQSFRKYQEKLEVKEIKREAPTRKKRKENKENSAWEFSPIWVDMLFLFIHLLLLSFYFK